MVISMAHPAIPARPMRWRVLRPARSTTKSCWMETRVHQPKPSLEGSPLLFTFPGESSVGQNSPKQP